MAPFSYQLAPLLVVSFAVLVLSVDALAQAGNQEAQGREQVLRATEGEPAILRNEVIRMYDAARRATGFHFYDPACIALGYWEWRRENPGENPGLTRFQARDEHGRISACADRDRIMSITKAHVERHLTVRTKGARLPQDQMTRIATCTADLMADRYLENPGPNPPDRGHQSEIRASALNECQREHGGR